MGNIWYFRARPEPSGLASADDYPFVAVGNLLAGFGTWLSLLILTALAGAAAAIDSRVRPAGASTTVADPADDAA